VKNLDQSSKNIVESTSGIIPSIPLHLCPQCLTDNSLMPLVNYMIDAPVEYFAFIVCLNCGYQSNGGGIFSDYHAAVCSAQEFWNAEHLEKPNGQKNPNKSE
jgi:hypothetical protein